MDSSALNKEIIIQEFLKSNKYPSYEELSDKLFDVCIDLDAEYSLLNHNYCRIIYKNLLNKACIFRYANLIFKKGGLQVLESNLEIIKSYSPLADCKNKIVTDYFSEIYKNLIEKFYAISQHNY